MKNHLKKLGIVLIAIITLSSCINLKHVNDFSVSSQGSIKTFENLNYSFKQSCIDRCVSENVKNLEIKAKLCDCTLDKIADSLTSKIYGSIYGYFDGLSNLSDNALTSYKTADLESALIEGDFGSITIEQKHVESYSKVSGILILAFTDTHRKNKIKEYVKEANAPVKTLIAFLDFNICDNLNGKLNAKKKRVKANYFDLIDNGSLSALEKRNAIKEYYAILVEIESQQHKLDIYSKSLLKISNGHQELYDNIDKLKLKEVKQVLFQYASEIKSILSEFKKLKA